ncbi:MAG: helix-turn-helix domain-containing protein, partial [Calditrichota bacterium]
TTGEIMGVGESEIIGKGRKQEVARARQIAMYLCREMTNSSLKTIGLHFGGRDHSTVVHACKVIEDKIKDDSPLLQQIKAVKHKLEIGQF